MKDGRTHLAYKAEHAVDLETGAIVAVTIQGADEGDTSSIPETLTEAVEHVDAALAADGGEHVHEFGVSEVVTDKGYHSAPVVTELQDLGLRTYIAEPDRGRQKWDGKRKAQAAVYANRRRIRRDKSKRLHRLRGERVERSFAHMYETGGMRRVHLRGRENILKRVLIHGSALNLGLLMRKAIGAGTPRGVTAILTSMCVALLNVLRAPLWLVTPSTIDNADCVYHAA